MPAAAPPTVPADSAGSPVPPVAARRRPGRRSLLLAGAAAAAVTGAVGAGALLTRSGAPAPLAAAQGGAASALSPFSDVEDGAEGVDAMVWADENGVQPALDGNSYSPGAAVMRGDLALALHRFAGSPAVPLDATPALIVDLGEAPDRAAALLWLHGRGALWGDASLQVHPDDPATQDCAAGLLTALLRPALAAVGATWDPSTGEPSTGEPSGTDAASAEEVGPWSALGDASWLEAAGILAGAITSSDWAGDERVTRGELAVTLHRADSVVAAALA
ncbi:hypothetical protein ACTXJK_08610 [Brachybacterium tyrofermentans]|uniref:hypothetical protein n=1 Tax=Brachybacterium tyrofermentans TaxID=47848 RepID=UPI003FD17C54